jgi:hypothetical protein
VKKDRELKDPAGYMPVYVPSAAGIISGKKNESATIVMAKDCQIIIALHNI